MANIFATYLKPAVINYGIFKQIKNYNYLSEVESVPFSLPSELMVAEAFTSRYLYIQYPLTKTNKLVTSKNSRH